MAGKDYFYDAVLWGVENGVVKGMDETHFEPETVCTRAQALDVPVACKRYAAAEDDDQSVR